MNKNSSVEIGKTPCHKCGHRSEAPSSKDGKPVCFSCYMKELPGPAPVEAILKEAGVNYSRSVDNGIDSLAEAQR